MLYFRFIAIVITLCFQIGIAQTPTPKPVSTVETPVSLKDYGEALQKERSLLQEQVKTHQNNIAELITRGMYLISGIVGIGAILLALFIGKTKKEVQENLQDYLKVEMRPLKEELETVKSELLQARGEISQLNDYKKRRVVWIRRRGSVGTDEEDQKLKATTGLEEIKPEFLIADIPIELKRVELVIFTYDGADAIPLLKAIVDALATKKLPLLVYAPGPRLEQAELNLLNAYGNYVPANSPLTLYERALSLAQLKGRR